MSSSARERGLLELARSIIRGRRFLRVQPVRLDVVEDRDGSRYADCAPGRSGRGWHREMVERRGAVVTTFPPGRSRRNIGVCRRACALRRERSRHSAGGERCPGRCATNTCAREKEVAPALPGGEVAESVRPRSSTRERCGRIRSQPLQRLDGVPGAVWRIFGVRPARTDRSLDREAHHLQAVCRRRTRRASVPGWTAGTQRTRSRPNISTALRKAQVPKCTGSKVPPMMPIGALFPRRSGAAASGFFFQRLSGANLAAAKTTYFCEVRLPGPPDRAHAACRSKMPISRPGRIRSRRRARRAFTKTNSNRPRAESDARALRLR